MDYQYQNGPQKVAIPESSERK